MDTKTRNWGSVAELAALSCFFAFCSVSHAAKKSTQDIAQQNEAAVVVITGTIAGTEVQGSGCCIATDLVLSTAHQVDGVDDLVLRFKDGATIGASLMSIDRERDLALLRSAQPLPALVSLGDAQTLSNGAELVSITAPAGLGWTTNRGIVSNALRLRGGLPFIQSDLPLSPGSSGGPVFDSDGNLVGIVAASIIDAEGVTLLTPINSAYPMLEKNGVSLMNGAGTTLAAKPLAAEETAENTALSLFNMGIASQAAKPKVLFYDRAVSLQPDFFEAWFNLAVAHTELKQYDSAIAAYEKALELRPESVEVHRNLGRVLLRRGELEAVLKHFEAGARLAPQDPQTYNDLGEVQRRLKRFDEAAVNFRKAIELRPGYSSAQYNLGLTLMESGQSPQAAAAFQAYLEAAPDAPDHKQVRQIIQQLEKE